MDAQERVEEACMINEIPKWKLEQLNIFDIGNTIQLSGVIYSDSEVLYLCLMPDEPLDGRQVRLLELDQEAWKKLIRQTDIVETEVLERAADGSLAKAIIRKSIRRVEQFIGELRRGSLWIGRLWLSA